MRRTSEDRTTIEVIPDREDTTGEYYFDDLTRGLASGTLSRGKALKLMGAALLGGALGFFSLPHPAQARRRHRRSHLISYHGGPIMLGPVTAYYIWYGDWSNNTATTILPDFINSLGGSPYNNINTTYYDKYGRHVTNATQLGGSTNNFYSHGTLLYDKDIPKIVSEAITSGKLPLDNNAVYFVLTSSDVSEASGFCTKYCSFRNHTTISGQDVKYAFVGGAARCPSACAPQQGSSPNGNPGADAMASHIAKEFDKSLTDPDLNGWHDGYGQANADKCAGTFGTEYKAANGSRANMRLSTLLGDRDFLIQQNWVNDGGGYCALKYPS